MVEQRNVALCVILTIVTCGIYGIYWLICLVNDLNYATGDVQSPSGGMVFLLDIVTCGIYGLYWCYKAGDKLDPCKAAARYSQQQYRYPVPDFEPDWA